MKKLKKLQLLSFAFIAFASVNFYGVYYGNPEAQMFIWMIALLIGCVIGGYKNHMMNSARLPNAGKFMIWDLSMGALIWIVPMIYLKTGFSLVAMYVICILIELLIVQRNYKE